MPVLSKIHKPSPDKLVCTLTFFSFFGVVWVWVVTKFFLPPGQRGVKVQTLYPGVLKLGETIHPVRLESKLNPAGLASTPLSTQVQSASDWVSVTFG